MILGGVNAIRKVRKVVGKTRRIGGKQEPGSLKVV